MKNNSCFMPFFCLEDNRKEVSSGSDSGLKLLGPSPPKKGPSTSKGLALKSFGESQLMEGEKDGRMAFFDGPILKES